MYAQLKKIKPWMFVFFIMPPLAVTYSTYLNLVCCRVGPCETLWIDNVSLLQYLTNYDHSKFYGTGKDVKIIKKFLHH